VPYATYIEWQGAQRWLWAPATRLWRSCGELALSVGGHATLFRASASACRCWTKPSVVNTPLDAAQARIQQPIATTV
jgi:glycolate oxidase FAD binding subunit